MDDTSWFDSRCWFDSSWKHYFVSVDLDGQTLYKWVNARDPASAVRSVDASLGFQYMCGLHVLEFDVGGAGWKSL